MIKYGSLPVSLGIKEVKVEEMFFYQYLPIKFSGQGTIYVEDRLKEVFHPIICECISDFKKEFGYRGYFKSNIYLTAKNLYQTPERGLNRPGWHSDGFLTYDINYIWSNNTPTTFNDSRFTLSEDHTVSLNEMESQAIPSNNIRYYPFTLLRLNQYNIHKATDPEHPGMRAFFKLSFSKDHYNLIGNSKSRILDYPADWEWHSRDEQRNHPTKSNSDTHK